jgi:hypothetical protein
MRIEGRAALDYPAYRRLVWVVGKWRFLKVWTAVLLIAAGALLLRPANGAVLLVALLVVIPLFFELSVRRVWRRLSAGTPVVEIGYEWTEDGLTMSLAGVSTRHRWDSLRPLQETARYWLFKSALSRRAIAVPKDAFSVSAVTEVDVAFARLR